MYTWEIEQMIMNNGVITQEQFIKIYDSKQVQCVLYDDSNPYNYELVLTDKNESLFFNIQN